VAALADIVTGGAAHPDLRSRLTVFDSTGIAMEDAIALQIFREYAEALGRGREIGGASRGDDPHNPYAFLIPADAECA
jgi:ornithine cyclodeaminase/alanine dehydrogenase-like protein (mu-crystallin family)